MAIQVELQHVIYALSDALDLVGIDDVAHGKRVGIMAAECGKAMQLPERTNNFLFDLGMLHDIGVSSTRTHGHLVGEFDWRGSQAHAELGCRLLEGFAPLAEMALPVRFHHTRWDQLAEVDVSDEVKWQANLIFLVDRVDALAAPYHAKNTLLMHVDEIRARIEAHRGDYFSPGLVDVFLRVSRTEAFWLLLEARSIQSYLQDMLARADHYYASMAEVRQLAELFARIVDAKSPFTGAHSLGVARLSRLIAERMSLDADACDKIEIAGLLHDLGKLRVPDEILDKPGKLDQLERVIINSHSFETYQILRNIRGFEEIAAWAAYHHEEPDGNGYPFHIASNGLPLEARILRVADIFQAMVQTRPYRRGLSAAEAMTFMHALDSDGRIDSSVLATVVDNLAAAMAAALPGIESEPLLTAH